MSSRRLLYLFLGALCVLRLLMIGWMELSPDEAYYTMWSKYPDISYYSKGPGVAAFIWVSTHLFGVNEFGVRFFSPLLALGSSLLMYAFARRLYGESVALWTVLTLNVIPIFQVGGLLMTIDPLSMFFWMAALATFWRALEEAEPGLNRWWPATGALIGAGFLCKWINALQLLSILLLLLTTPRHRRELLRGGFWTMLAVFAVFTIPPIVWNEQHDWITLAHLSARGGLQKSMELSAGEFFTFLAGQFLVYSPLLFAAMLATIWLGGRRARTHFKPRFLLAFSLPVLGLYFALSMREAGEANWTAPGMLSLCLLAVALWHEASQSEPGAPAAGFFNPARARLFSLGALILGAVMSLLIVGSDLMREIGIAIPYERDSTARLRGWKTSAEVVDDFRSKFEKQLGKPVFLIANKYQTAAALGFYLPHPRIEAPGHPPIYIPESQVMENQFSFWPRYDEMEELEQIAEPYLAAPAADPALHAEVAAALEAVAHDDRTDPAATTDRRRRLVQTLQRALPNLPLDDSFVEEQGVSLFAGRAALYITDRAEERAPSTIKEGFGRVEMVGCIDVTRRGLPLRQLRIFACYEYRGMPL